MATTAQKISVPDARQRAVEPSGVLTPQWFRFAEDLASRRCAFVADLGASPTTAQIATAFNALLAALQAADLQETS